MAPAGATRQLLTPGQDPMALITRLRSFFLLFLMVLPVVYGRPSRTQRLISANDDYYFVNDRIRCQLCPAGTYVMDPCTIQDAKGICDHCPMGTYIMYPSGLSECISCSRCRDDQEEVSSCTITKNTICKCKKGTFCPPDQPCEICRPCTTSCPEDQVVKEPCNSTSDLLCTTPSTSSSSTRTRDIIIAFVIVAVALIIIIIIIGVWKLRKRRNNDTGCKLFGKLTVHICKGKEECEEVEDHLLDDNTLLQFNKDKDGKDSDEDVNKSFAIIVWLTPSKHFESLMLKLGLTPNEIYGAKEDNPSNVQNRHLAMLHALNQQKKFDINVYLKSLRSFDLKKAAHDIANRLLSEELCVPKTQQ